MILYSKLKFLSFMTKANPNNENETKLFHGTYSNLTPYLFYYKNHESISMIFKVEISQFND